MTDQPFRYITPSIPLSAETIREAFGRLHQPSPLWLVLNEPWRLSDPNPMPKIVVSPALLRVEQQARILRRRVQTLRWRVTDAWGVLTGRERIQ